MKDIIRIKSFLLSRSKNADEKSCFRFNTAFQSVGESKASYLQNAIRVWDKFILFPNICIYSINRMTTRMTYISLCSKFYVTVTRPYSKWIIWLTQRFHGGLIFRFTNKSFNSPCLFSQLFLERISYPFIYFIFFSDKLYITFYILFRTFAHW